MINHSFRRTCIGFLSMCLMAFPASAFATSSQYDVGLNPTTDLSMPLTIHDYFDSMIAEPTVVAINDTQSWSLDRRKLLLIANDKTKPLNLSFRTRRQPNVRGAPIII